MLKRALLGTFMLVAARIWLLGVTNVLAGEVPVPSTGLLYSTNETHSLEYHCQQNSDNSLIDCEFAQVIVRRKATPGELDSVLNVAREIFRNGARSLGEECKSSKTISDLVDLFDGRKKPPPGADFKEIGDMQKKDLLKDMKAKIEFCKSRTEENFLNIFRFSHEIDTRTCLVSSNTFSHSFRYVYDGSEAHAWVAQASPEGPCGIVQLSRFESEQSEGSDFILWKYVAKRAVTNPQGSLSLGGSCKKLYMGEHVFDSRSKTSSLSCDYIEFSPL